MFSGIIEELGTVEQAQIDNGSLRLLIGAPGCSAELHINDSVSINGVCQTVISKSDTKFEVQSVEETLGKTTLGSLRRGDAVNLELPLRLHDRLDGHIVLGHVDGIGTITGREPRESSHKFSISFDPQFSRYLVPTGSLAVDGISLTIAELAEDEIRVSIIPHTMEHTVLKYRNIGDNVNLEFDVLGKYVERMLRAGKSIPDEEKFLSQKHLRELGF